MHSVMRSMKKNVSFDQVVQFLLDTYASSLRNKMQMQARRSQRQEFLFGSLPYSVFLSNSDQVREMLDEIDQLPQDQKTAVVDGTPCPPLAFAQR